MFVNEKQLYLFKLKFVEMVGVGVVKKCVFDDLRVSQGTDRDNRCRHDDSFKFQDFFIFIFSTDRLMTEHNIRALTTESNQNQS